MGLRSNPNGSAYNQRKRLSLSSEAPRPEREQNKEANITESVAKPVSSTWSTTPLGKCHSRRRPVGNVRLFFKKGQHAMNSQGHAIEKSAFKKKIP